MIYRYWWCLSCGLVATADEAPICRHFVVDGPPVRKMVPLPEWHPIAKQLRAMVVMYSSHEERKEPR